jgi:alpha-beta hydrolase superfamily lysophospholipase
MKSNFLRAIIFWLGLFELLAGWRGWRGLSWMRRAGGPVLAAPLLPLALAGMRGGGAGRALILLLAAPVALVIQVAAASLRNRALDPLARLRPGSHGDRVVTDLHIAMPEGYLPAIEIAPVAGTTMAVCLLHGSGDHKTAYTWWMVDALLARGIATLLVDLDGHGDNPRMQRCPEITEDVTAAVGWLRERYARVGVLGLSLGGCVAARAIADGAPADALVLMEAPPRLHFTRADMWREGMSLLAPSALAMFQDCTAYQIARTWPSAPIRAAISTWDLIDALDLLGSLQRIGTPLLALYGGSDSIVKPAQALQVRDALPPGATFRLVPGASHLTLFLRPDIQRAVAAWFQQVMNRQ